MWKRFGVMWASFFFLLFGPGGAETLLAVCGSEPQLPAGGFSWPAQGAIANSWSLDCNTDKGHRGVDIAVPAGYRVRSSASGVVSYSGYTPAEGGGITISIDHTGGLRTTYLHLSESFVSKGQTLSGEEEIGVTDGSPLHFGIKLSGGSRDAYFNPADLLPAMAAMAEPQPVTAADVGAEAGVPQSGAAGTGPAPQPQPVAQSAQLPEASATTSANGFTAESPSRAGQLTGLQYTASLPGTVAIPGEGAAAPGSSRGAPATPFISEAPFLNPESPLLSKTQTAKNASRLGSRVTFGPVRLTAVALALLLVVASAGAAPRIFQREDSRGIYGRGGFSPIPES